MYKYICMICIFFILTSCQGKHCVKVGGEFSGATGEVEYCYDTGESKKAETPVLKDENGKKAVIVNEEQMNRILDKIPKPMVTKKIEKDGIREDTLTKFLRLIQK